ncbi:MAG: hypothetical protein CME31_28845 [Gimesia sp.]|uniref:RloB domain-containing protein n=1 Tax=Gimesia maris TaxID=122 RepID=A0A3D3RBK7_9PLAN|nr:hypothetical protein [Gimesia sp.]HCO24980.1 hypothetical protein [Gimesia maris]
MRRARPLDRNTDPARDTKLVVIASEDRYAVRQYFEFFRSPRIQFKCLETIDGKSAPEHVLQRLNDYIEEFDIGEEDEFWLVTDTDHWIEPGHIQGFISAIRQCRDKGIKVAVSRPCFELWLLLHFEEFPTSSNLTCREVIELLKRVDGGYNKNKIYNLAITEDAVSNAISRSKANANRRSGEIPQKTESRMHLILDEMLTDGLITIAQSSSP